MKKNIKPIVFCIIIVAVIAAVALLPVKDWLVKALQWTQQLGIWGPIFVVAFYICRHDYRFDRQRIGSLCSFYGCPNIWTQLDIKKNRNE
jgi:hypothetical protein